MRPSSPTACTYINAVSYGSDGRVETYSLETESGGDVYPIVMACDTIYGGFTVTEMIAYAESLGYNVVGAVNADFGESTACPRAWWWKTASTSPRPAATTPWLSATGVHSSAAGRVVTLRFTNEESGFEYETSHLNKSRTDTGSYVYSEYFSTVSTRTSGEGWFVRFEVIGGDDLRLDESVERA